MHRKMGAFFVGFVVFTSALVYSVVCKQSDSRCIVMIILCLELNYYYLNPKITHINLKPNRNPIIVLYIDLDLNKTRHMDFQ